MLMARIKKIFLAKMANFGANLCRDLGMVIDDQSNAGAPGDRHDGCRHLPDFIKGGILGAKLDQVRPAVAKLLCHSHGRAPAQIGRIDKRIKPAVGQRFHGRQHSGEFQPTHQEWWNPAGLAWLIISANSRIVSWVIRRDYILRMIEEFAEVLRRIDAKIDGNAEEAGELLDKAFLDLVGMGADAVSQLSEEELMARLTMEGPTHTVRVKAAVLVALLQQAGETHAVAGRDTEAEVCWLKALNILLILQMQDADFELPEFVPTIDLLRAQLGELPLRTEAALWRHYERIGAYGRSEDALCALLESEPDNSVLKTEARSFYERLLRQSDDALESGNLPRAEVEEGLAKVQ